METEHVFSTNGNGTRIFHQYADDTNVFYKHENIDMMCKIVSVELDKLSTWFALNKLALNISKTNFMIFSNHKSRA